MHTGNTQPKAKAALPSYDKTTRRCRDDEWSRLLERETREERCSYRVRKDRQQWTSRKFNKDPKISPQ
jgi:hypothetical protein